MKKALQLGIAIALLSGGLLSLWLYANRETIVVWEFSEPGDPIKEPAAAIFNPFRDRGPELAAERFLGALAARDGAKASSVGPADAKSWLPKEMQSLP